MFQNWVLEYYFFLLRKNFILEVQNFLSHSNSAPLLYYRSQDVTENQTFSQVFSANGVQGCLPLSPSYITVSCEEHPFWFFNREKAAKHTNFNNFYGIFGIAALWLLIHGIIMDVYPTLFK